MTLHHRTTDPAIRAAHVADRETKRNSPVRWPEDWLDQYRATISVFSYDTEDTINDHKTKRTSGHSWPIGIWNADKSSTRHIIPKFDPDS